MITSLASLSMKYSRCRILASPPAPHNTYFSLSKNCHPGISRRAISGMTRRRTKQKKKRDKSRLYKTVSCRI